MKFIALIAFVTIQLWMVAGMPKPNEETPAAATEASTFNLDNLITKAQDNFKSMSEHVNEMLGLPKALDSEKVFEAVKTNTDTWAKEVTGLVDQLKAHAEASKDGEVGKTIKSVQEKFEKTVEDLKKQYENTDIKEKTKGIQDSFTKSLNSIVEEADKLSKSAGSENGISEDVKKLSKQVVDQAVKAANQFQKSVHEATGHSKSGDHTHDHDGHDHAGHDHAGHDHANHDHAA